MHITGGRQRTEYLSSSSAAAESVQGFRVPDRELACKERGTVIRDFADFKGVSTLIRRWFVPVSEFRMNLLL